MFLLAAIFAVAMLALGLYRQIKNDSKRNRSARRKIRNLALAFTMGVEMALALPSQFRRAMKYRGRGLTPYFANAEIGEGTHENTTTKFSAVAITTRHLLYKFDPNDATTKQLVVCGAGDRAIFVVPDECSTTDLNNQSPAPIEAIMLGSTNNSVRMVAAGAITAGSIVYPAASGQINTYVGLGSTGTNFPCGIAITSSTVAGQVIEVMAELGLGSVAL